MFDVFVVVVFADSAIRVDNKSVGGREKAIELYIRYPPKRIFYFYNSCKGSVLSLETKIVKVLTYSR